VFYGRYAGPADGPDVPVVAGEVTAHPPKRATPADLADELRRVPGLLAVGGGAVRYGDVLAPVTVAAGPIDPDPGVLVSLAAHRVLAGQALVAPQELRPVYLRDADARINWSTR
jgi:hypothetical protein